MSARITTLGQVRVVAHGHERPGLPQQRLRCALLIYIACETDCSREALLRVFWPDRPSGPARHGLSQSLYELRKSLGEDAIVAEGDRIRIGPGVSIDVRDFEDAVERGDFEAALRFYQGGFLADFSVPNANGFDPWVDRKRAQIARLHRRARREHLQSLRSAGREAEALAAARIWADLEPLDDEALHALFELLIHAGERTEARLRFDEYRRALKEELDVEPLEETVALFADETPAASPSARPASPPAPEAAEKPDRPAASDTLRHPQTQRPVPARFQRYIGRKPIAAAVVLAALALAAVPRIREGMRGDVEPSSAALVRDPDFDRSRVAVLYFEDHSPDQSLAHIARGLTNDLITSLTQVDALSVVPRSGVMRFDGASPTASQVADAFDAGTIVTGYVQKSADRLRLTVDIAGPDGTFVASDTLHRPMGEMFDLQDDLVHRLSRFLLERIGRQVSIQRSRREADNVEAWELVQRATLRMEEFSQTEASIATEQRNRAFEAFDAADANLAAAEKLTRSWIEPTLQRGWVSLGRSRAIPSMIDSAAYNAAIRTGLGFAERVLEREPRNARGYELRGTLRYHLARANGRDLRFLAVRDSAKEDLSRALQLEPGLAGAATTLSRLLQFAGEPREARAYANQALRYDAYLREGADIRNRLFHTSLELEEFDVAEEHCRQGRADYPRDRRFVICLVSLYAIGPHTIPADSALVLIAVADALDPRPRERDIAYRHTYRDALYAAILARNGEQDKAREALDRLRGAVRDDPRLAIYFPLDEAHICLLLGDTDGALDAVEQYLRFNPHYRDYVARAVQMKSIHGDPRFRTLIDNAGRD